ncbi:hypothetical protein ACNJJD_21115, partial [Mycobacterium tuberculosis]
MTELHESILNDGAQSSIEVIAQRPEDAPGVVSEELKNQRDRRRVDVVHLPCIVVSARVERPHELQLSAQHG